MSAIDLSIIIPAYNEEKFLPSLLKSLTDLQFVEPIKYEIIVIDDASTDGTSDLLNRHSYSSVLLHRLEVNSGKGAAVKKGISLATGRYLIIQDADLEYFPSDIPALLESAKRNPGASIYGSRVLGAKNLQGINGLIRLWPKQSIASFFFNYLLSVLIFILQKLWLTDSLTGYKLYPQDIFNNWAPLTNGFEMDHEITSRILTGKREIIEIPIKYAPRTKSDGKKIRAIDGLIALKTFWHFRK